MDLKETLGQVESFCRVLSLQDLLAHTGLALAIESADEDVRTFCKTTLVLIEREIQVLQKEKRHVSFEEFLSCFDSLLGSKKLNINDFVAERYDSFPSNHIQRKDIMSSIFI